MRIVLEDPYERDLFHAGELAAQRRFGVEAEAREMKGTIHDQLSASHAQFIASQPFFFLTVQVTGGAIHTQMLACAQTAQGTYPLVAFGDAQRFYFLLRETEGTQLLALLENPGPHSSPAPNSNPSCQAGLIFVDFAQRARLRVNGLLQLADRDALPGFQCPAEHRLMAMHVAQVYANCATRIARLMLAPKPNGES